MSDSELVLLGYPFHLAFAPVMSLQWNQVCQSVQEMSVTEYTCLSAVRYSQVPMLHLMSNDNKESKETPQVGLETTTSGVPSVVLFFSVCRTLD